MKSRTFASLFFLLLLTVVVDVGEGANCSGQLQPCRDGMLLPVWHPVEGMSTGDRVGKGFVYFIFLLYLFLGVSILSDTFMQAIERITSSEREVTVKKPSGEVFTVTVRIWNETVSNLTLMALGSSAPEIMLSIIEVCGNKFEAGDLGPNTIVGSAAFNLFMIVAICVYVIPSTEVRRQKHLNVFFVTATWSVFAYVWLYIILAVITPKTIDVWEGVLTFLFFPITVFHAYVTDRRWIKFDFVPKRLRMGKRGILEATETGDLELNNVDGLDGSKKDGYRLVPQEDVDPAVRAFEQHRREFMEIFKEMRKKHPTTDIETLQQWAEYEMLNRGPKSRAFYRVQATRKLTGGGNLIKKHLEKEHHRSMEQLSKEEALKKSYTAKIGFNPAHYTVLENCGTCKVIVTREGGPPDLTVIVDYQTDDGTANAGSDYVGVQGTLTFHPDERHKEIDIEIIDDDIFEEDEHFYVHISNLRVKTKDGVVLDPMKLGGMPLAELDISTATVMILDDDHAGVFSLEHQNYEIVESAGHIHLKVLRSSGARGRVIIPYRTIDGTAVSPRDFEPKEGEVVFDNDETEKVITIGVIDDEDYEKNEEFYVEIGEPIWAKKLSERGEHGGVSWRSWLSKEGVEKQSTASAESPSREPMEDDQIADLGKPKLGEIVKATIKIKESKEFKNVVDRMLKTANTSFLLGSHSWRDQFSDAFTVSGGDDDEGGEGEGEGEAEGEKEEKLPTCGDYVMHFLCLPWKIMCAFVPPTDYGAGWVSFVTTILLIGFFTALIGDVASHFGCMIGLKDAVNAISFIAMGTSVPDTFASKVSAIQDKYADGSIGNVTGSNAVNVFLGIGIAWSLAAIYHWAIGTPGGFHVEPGTLAYSVVIFCAEALVCIFVICLRRLPPVGGELGGPMKYKLPTSLFFFLLWLLYLTLSALESYCVVEGF